MSFYQSVFLLLAVSFLCACQTTSQSTASIKVATFNVSMEATNYVGRNNIKNGELQLKQRLQIGVHSQIKNIAEILQRQKPDIVLLNEFDYIENPDEGVRAFIKNYLHISQNGAEPIDYPYFFYAPVNTGVATDFDLNNDGQKSGLGADAQGFGFFPGHYGMMLLSKYPIDLEAVRTFQYFKWSDMPDAIKPIDPKTNLPFYNQQEWQALRLSSKSHWDIPIKVGSKTLHVLASHPTPPVFDGPDDHNGSRNHDEVRFWVDYITPSKGDYIYDDKGVKGGISAGSQFVVAGDLNASPYDGDAIKGAIQSLVQSNQINSAFTPQSDAGKLNKPDNLHANTHTAGWGARADYVLPSNNITILQSGIFWPIAQDPLFRLIEDRKASSDHRLVWVEIKL